MVKARARARRGARARRRLGDGSGWASRSASAMESGSVARRRARRRRGSRGRRRRRLSASASGWRSAPGWRGRRLRGGARRRARARARGLAGDRARDRQVEDRGPQLDRRGDEAVDLERERACGHGRRRPRTRRGPAARRRSARRTGGAAAKPGGAAGTGSREAVHRGAGHPRADRRPGDVRRRAVIAGLDVDEDRVAALDERVLLRRDQEPAGGGLDEEIERSGVAVVPGEPLGEGGLRRVAVLVDRAEERGGEVPVRGVAVDRDPGRRACVDRLVGGVTDRCDERQERERTDGGQDQMSTGAPLDHAALLVRCERPTAIPCAVMSTRHRVGVQLPEVEREVRWPEMLDLARAIDDLGFDGIWLGEHLLYRWPGRPARGPWEAWTLMAALAAVTTPRSSGRSSPARLPQPGAAREAGRDDRRDLRRAVRPRARRRLERDGVPGLRLPVRAAGRPIRGGVHDHPDAARGRARSTSTGGTTRPATASCCRGPGRAARRC